MIGVIYKEYGIYFVIEFVCIIVEELLVLGVNVNYVLIVDVNMNLDNLVINVCLYGEDL